jgi:hypothetical protein
MLLGIPRSARCVQRFDDSLNSAIHITYRISLRSSSMREPRDPLLKVVYIYQYQRSKHSDSVERLCNDIDLGTRGKAGFEKQKAQQSSIDLDDQQQFCPPGSTISAQLEE